MTGIQGCAYKIILLGLSMYLSINETAVSCASWLTKRENNYSLLNAKDIIYIMKAICLPLTRPGISIIVKLGSEGPV